MSDWLEPLRQMKAKFAEQRAKLRKLDNATMAEQARVERIISGEKVRRSASRAKKDAERIAAQQKAMREESQRLGAPNSSSVVQETLGGSGGRETVRESVETDTE